jgi:diaminopimelate decarboxylase
VIHGAGVGAEVVDGYELWLAGQLGVAPDDVVFNGPNKRDAELRSAIEQDIGLLVIDGIAELERVERLTRQLDRRARIALRICPDIVPRGMNASSLTGSRKNQFGLDDRAGEVDEAIRRAVVADRVQLRGIHAHIGSGIHDLTAFEKAAERVLAIQARAFAAGAEPDLIDLGGGLGTRLSREFTTTEMLVYLGLGRLPKEKPPGEPGLLERYGRALSGAIEGACKRLDIPLPTLVLEPGRALVSDAQVLLLTVGAVRERPGVGRFALTDGGAMTVSMMFLSELHAVLLANRDAPLDGRTNVFGHLPSPMDVVYRNAPLPRLEPDDVLAVMDAGAYFTATSTNFGGPRPGVVLLDQGAPRLVRRPETFEDLSRVEQDI